MLRPKDQTVTDQHTGQLAEPSKDDRHDEQAGALGGGGSGASAPAPRAVARETVDEMVEAGLFDDLYRQIDEGGLRLTGEGALRPYARFTWDSELEDAPEEAFAIAQTMAASGPYAVPTYGTDDSYGTVTLGARTALFGLDANVGVSGTVGYDGGGNTAVFLSLGRGF